MNIKTSSGLIGLLLALAAVNTPSASATQSSNPTLSSNTAQTINSRLTKLSAIIRERETLVPTDGSENFTTPTEDLLAFGSWANGNGGAWRRGLFGGFVNGGFGNAPWGNGWPNVGGFWNY